MRAFWLTLLATGLLLVTIDVYEGTQSNTEAALCLTEDGSGYPNPTPTPIAK